MKKNTRVEIKNREAKEGRNAGNDLLNDEKMAYVATSPHAKYDQNRNLRQIKAAQVDNQKERQDDGGDDEILMNEEN